MSNSAPPNGKLVYRLLTGKDDQAFCERVSQAVGEGYELYGLPIVTFDPARGEMRVAQAVLWTR